jgi:hypothetical protein
MGPRRHAGAGEHPSRPAAPVVVRELRRVGIPEIPAQAFTASITRPCWNPAGWCSRAAARELLGDERLKRAYLGM